MTIPAGFSSVRKQSISRKTSSLKSWTRLCKAIHFSKAFFKASKYQFLLCSSVKCHFIPSLSSLDQPNSCQVSILPLLELHEGSRTPCKCSLRCTASIWVRRILLRRFVHFNSTPLFDSLQTETRTGSVKVGRQGSKRHVTLLLGTAFGQPKSILKLQLQWLSQLFLTKQLCQSQAGKGVTDTAMLAQAHTVIQSQPLSCEDGVVKLGKPCHESCVYSSTLTLLC